MGESVTDILQIKISLPPLKSDLVSRSYIWEQVVGATDEEIQASPGAYPRLILVSAAAGFGKSTAVREWMAGLEDRVAWSSLDAGDNEVDKFWIYLVSALQRVEKDIGRGTLELLRSSNLMTDAPVSVQEILTPLLNDLLYLEKPLYLVLDDYHLIDNTQIHEGMSFFIENLPPYLRLIVATRSEPPWPLAKWRSKGWTAEVRQNHLKFSVEETSSFLRDKLGEKLDEEDTQALYEKTEGWITALQLVAYSLGFQDDPYTFIKNFAGENRQIFYFLTEEVFNRQSPSVRNFLMETSILKRFCPSLCNAVTGRSDSREILNMLEERNLFVFPLDESGYWYRYHHLFTDILYYYLMNKEPTKISTLHERASKWFEEAGDPGEAIRHALGAENYEKVAFLLHEHVDYLWAEEGVKQSALWMDALSRELMEKYPRIIAYRAIINVVEGNWEEAASCFKQGDDLSFEGDDEESKRENEVRGILAVARTYYAFLRGDLENGMYYAEEALRILPEDVSFWRIFAGVAYGDVKTFLGDLESAYDAFLEAYRSSRKESNFFAAVSSGMNLTKIMWMRGELKEARKFTEELLRLAKEEGMSNMPRVGASWTFLGELLREEGELDEALRCSRRGVSMSDSENLMLEVVFLFQAMVCFSRREFDDALQLLDYLDNDEREVNLPAFIYNVLLAWKARVLLEHKGVAASREVLDEADLENLEGIFFPQSIQLVSIRVLIEEGRLNEARQSLDSLKSLSQYPKSRRLIINTLLLEAYLEWVKGNEEVAENLVAEALYRGQESKFYQIFLDEGKEIAFLFFRLVKNGALESGGKESAGGSTLLNRRGMQDYLEKICAGLEAEGCGAGDAGEESGGVNAGSEKSDPAQYYQEFHQELYQELVEDLSSRELEILNLISQGYSNQDISGELFLSLGTVKWHNSNIFGKLGVRNRTEAVARARELGLLSRA